MTKEDLSKFDRYALDRAVESKKDISRCPNIECNYTFFFQEGIADFTCDQCKQHYCLNCRAKFHRGQSCQEYQVSNRKGDKSD